jgi:hypothetical protein
MVHPVETGLELGSIEMKPGSALRIVTKLNAKSSSVELVKIETIENLDDLYDFDCRR